MSTLANAFAARGLAVDLVLASAEGPFLEAVDPAVRIVDFGKGRVIKALWPLACYLRRQRPRAMLSAMAHANSVAVLARALSMLPLRLVVSQRNTPSVMNDGRGGFAARVNDWLYPYLYRFADGICTVSEGVSDDLARHTGLARSRIVTIYNPFDLERIEVRAAAPVHHPWFVEPGPPIVLAVGRLNPQKGFDTLIKAVALLRESRAVRLLILGEGAERGALQSLADSLGFDGDAFQMPGFVQEPHGYLARCDLFVLSSRFEGLPGVLIEAMACGAPVVSTNCPSGPDEILEHGRWGRLVAVDDVPALARAMDEALAVPRDRAPRVRDRARDFGMQQAVDAYLRLLEVPCP